MNRKTIAAIATPAGSGGIGIVRISGPDALTIGSEVFRPKNSEHTNHDPQSFSSAAKPRTLYLGYVVSPQTGIAIDQVLFVFMRKPCSYTGEDVVEIQAHAGRAVLQKILEIVLEKGADLAEPGEFTRRAFLNGRIDLTQAEAVMTIMEAQTEEALYSAAASIDGRLADSIRNLREKLIRIHTEIEAEIDFSDDTEGFLDTSVIEAEIRTGVLSKTDELIQNYGKYSYGRGGVRLVIVGGPNVGKSSIMNRLLRKDRSIVTEIAGTTRDHIEDVFHLEGIPIVVSDTAGIRISSDPIETIGIERAKEVIKGAGLILFVLDAERRIEQEDHQIFELVRGKKIIFVVNKCDLVEKGALPNIPKEWMKDEPIVVSALKNEGIDVLTRKIQLIATTPPEAAIDIIVPNVRQCRALKRCQDAIQNALGGFDQKLGLEVVALDIKEAVLCLDEILGIQTSEDILDHIFRNFCIGK